MAKKICAICGNEYEYCNNCKADMDQPRWKFLFDKENCKDIWETLNAYKTGAMTPEDAKMMLDMLDTSVVKAKVNDTIQEIYNKATPYTAPVIEVEEPAITITEPTDSYVNDEAFSSDSTEPIYF